MSAFNRMFWSKRRASKSSPGLTTRLRGRFGHLLRLEDRLSPVVNIVATMQWSLAADNFTGGPATGTVNQGDVIRYTVGVTNTGDTAANNVVFADDKIDALTTLIDPSIKISPLPLARSFKAVGNTPLTIAVGSGLRTGIVDLDPVGATPNGSLVIGKGSVNPAKGAVAINADGSFTYTPNVGIENTTDTFTYTVTDLDGMVGTGTVTIDIGDRVWYVDNKAAAGGTGTFGSRFDSLADVTGATGPDTTNDIIYLVSTGTAYTGGITLLANQQLIGGGVALTVNTINVFAAGANSIVQNAAGNAITFVDGATIDGLSVTSASGGGLVGTGVNSLTVGAGVVLSGITGNDIDINGGNGSFTITQALTNTAGRSISIANRTGGTVTFSGAISDTGTGIALTNNTGATINFTGGLTLNTGASAAFAATGGGTTSVTGANNTIVTSTGTALNVTNTNIGASGLAFKSISSNGAVNGIVLNTTGANGGLTVSGDGGVANNGSGGTIQNTTGPGISLNSASKINLNYMNIQNSGDDGISGTNVTGFTMNRSNVTNNGNAINEDGVDFGVSGSVSPVGLFGTVSVTNSAFTGNYSNQFTNRHSTSGAVTMTMTGLTITGRIAENNNNDGIFLEAGGTTTITATISGSTFSGVKGDHFQGNGLNSGSLNITYSGNTHMGGHTTALGAGITLAAATGVAFGGWTGKYTYDIDNNKFTGCISNAIAVVLGTSGVAGTFTGKVRNNTIGTSGVALSGSTQANGVYIDARGNGTHTALVTNNVIRQCFDRGILSEAGDGNPVLNLTVTSNTIDQQVDPSARESIQTNFGITSTNVFGEIDTPIVSLTIGGAGGLANIFSHGAGAPDDFRLRKRFEAKVSLPGYTGGTGQTVAELDQVVAFIRGQNTGSAGEPGSASASGTGGGYTNGPPTPQPLFFQPPADEAPTTPKTIEDPSNAPDVDAGDDSSELEVGVEMRTDDGQLTPAELDALVAAAIARWESTGLTPVQLELLHSVTFEVTDLPGWYLGAAYAGHIQLDIDAVGYGWFIDETPFDDTEFPNAVASTRMYASSSMAPAGQLDALTTVMHELGHQLGLPDFYGMEQRNNLMFGYLTLGERRLPATGQADGLTPKADMRSEFMFTPLNIGKLDPGSTVSIKFEVKVNDPLAHNVTSVSNQGRVEFDTAQTKNTDDPTTGAANDATVTPILVINRAPTVANAIPDQVFTGAGSKSFQFAVNTFADLDADPLTYSAKLVGGAALPTWLTFTPGTRTFAGNPGSTDTTPLQIRVTADDGFGGSVFDDFQLTLTTVNDAPVLTPGTPTLTGIKSDITVPANVGDTVSTLIGARITDGDALDSRGVAVTAVSLGGGGKWQYALNGTTFVDFPAVTATAPLLLNADGDTRIRFFPTAQATSTPSVTWRAWDRTAGGVEGAQSSVDPAGGGGGTAFSSATESATIKVTDATPPAAPVVTAPAGPVFVNSTPFNIAGTAEADSKVEVYSDANNDGIINGADAVVATQQLTGGATAFSIATPLSLNVANNFLVTATDSSTNKSAVADVPTITHDTVLPTATVVIGDGTAQRSRITSITVNFSERMKLPAMPETAFTVVGPNGAVTLSADTVTLSTAMKTVAVLTFSGPNAEFASLKDGNYTVTILAASISDLAGNVFDGDGNGTGSDNQAVNFHRLFGDANGDRSVSATDFNAFRLTYGQNSSIFSFDGAGPVDATDFNEFRLRYGSTLVP